MHFVTMNSFGSLKNVEVKIIENWREISDVRGSKQAHKIKKNGLKIDNEEVLKVGKEPAITKKMAI